MSINRYILAAGAAALALSLMAPAAGAMPAPDDDMDGWPRKLQEVANPYDMHRPAVPGEFRKADPGQVQVNPEPQPWIINPQGVQIRR